jgi:hypothetical protein
VLSIPIAVGTQAMLQQVMGHKDAGIFQAYINERIQCDVQAAFLGRPSADALFKSISHMKRDVDPRAPTELNDFEVDSLKTHPLIIELREQRDNLSRETRRIHKTLKNAEDTGSKMYELYKQANADLESTKKSLKRSKLKESRIEFFNRIETDDARRQLGVSALDLKQEDWKPTEVEHALQERKRVAALLCNPPSNLTIQGKQRYRMEMIEAFVALCKKKEMPRNRRPVQERDWGLLPSPEPIRKPSPEPGLAPTLVTNKQCIFCICKTHQVKDFCRPRKAREHVETQHLRYFGKDELIPCPDEFCRLSGIVLFGHTHFKSHVQTMHKCSLLPYTLN